MSSTLRRGALVFLVAVCATACAAPAETPTVPATQPPPTVESKPTLPDEIRIGGAYDFSGPLAGMGELSQKGIELAHKHKPSVLGVPVRLIWGDTRTDKTEATLLVTRLIEVEKAHAILGTCASGIMMAMSEVTEKVGIPLMTTYATSPLVTQDQPHTFRTCFHDGFAVPAIAKYAVEDLGAKTAAVLVQIDSDYSVLASKYFVDAFVELTGDPDSIVVEVSGTTKDTDFTGQLATIKAASPDVVSAFYDYGAASMALMQAKDMGLIPGVYFLSGAGWDLQKFVDITGDASNAARWTSKYHPDAFTHEKAQVFFEAYQDEYGEIPSGFANEAYDGYMLYLDAIERAGSVDPEAITKALAETKDWMGVSGTITMDANGNPLKSTAICGADDGNIVFFKLIEP